MATLLTADDLRAEIARRNLHNYIVAARIPLHPVRLGRVLNGHSRLTPELADRIMQAIEGATLEQRRL